MTSTSVNNGYHVDKKTSRVLRPPGGGHTDIFAAPEPEPVRKDYGRNASSIIEGKSVGTNQFQPVQPPPTPVSAPTPPQPQEQPPPTSESAPIRPQPEPQEQPPPAQKPASQVQAQVQQPAAAPQSRVRVPPGGFSSGLW